MGICCMAQETQTGALYQPRGVGWGGKWEGGLKERVFIYIYLWLSHVEVWQKTTEFWKAFILQLKKRGLVCNNQSKVTLLLLSRFSHVRLCDPIDGSHSGSPIPGILQARTLEWVVSSFSNAWKWKVQVKSLSRIQLLMTPWTAAYQAPPSMGFSRQKYWSGLPLRSPKVTLLPSKINSLKQNTI